MRTRSSFFLNFVAMLAASLIIIGVAKLPWFTESHPLIPRQILFGNPEKLGPQISPDGKLVAYLAPDNGVLNVWVRTIGQSDDRAVTADKIRGIPGYFWQPDSKRILYVQDQNGDENWHIYQTNLETKATRDLTPFKGVQARVIAVSGEIPNRILVGLNIRDARFHDVYRLDLDTGDLQLDTRNRGDVSGWHADNSLQVRIAHAVLPDGGSEIRIRDDRRSRWRSFLKWGADESFGGIGGFFADNSRVWLVSSVGANTARLLEVEIATGKTLVVAEDKKYDLSGFIVKPRKRTLEAVLFQRERSEWMLLDDSLEADFDAIRRVRDGDFHIVSRDLDDKVWVVRYIVDNGPIYWYLYDRASKESMLLFCSRPDLEKYRLAKMEPISFRARDGLILYGYLTLPAGVEPKNLPMVLDVHGGPWGRDLWGFNSEVQWLANRGYAVLQINFRGSTGYGKDYLNAGDREWAGKMHTDLLDGKEWAVKQGYADPKRVAIFGGSYGGYATLVGLSFTPDEFNCGVDVVGPSNLVTLIRSIPPYWSPERAIFDKRVGNVDTEEEFLKSRSPLFKADKIKVPLLIAHGANDPRVKQSESDQIVEAVRKNGKHVEYLIFPDEGHGFSRPENRLKFYAAAETFLARILGGRAEPISENERADDLRR
jgi:dipeptidyl aminopeptidase/acylaminoacyl peptidase